MLFTGPTKSVTMATPRLAKEVVGFLIGQSAWFELTPLPDNEFRIAFKEENQKKVLAFVARF